LYLIFKFKVGFVLRTKFDFFQDPFETPEKEISAPILGKKTNMEPENGGPLEEEIPFGSQHYQFPC